MCTYIYIYKEGPIPSMNVWVTYGADSGKGVPLAAVASKDSGSGLIKSSAHLKAFNTN